MQKKKKKRCGGGGGWGGGEFMREKKSLHVQHIFLCIFLPLFCTTSTYVKLPSCTLYGGKVVYIPSTFQFFLFATAHFNLAGR